MKSVFAANIEILKDRFPSAGGEYTQTHYFYHVHLSEKVYAEVYYQVPFETPFLKRSIWLIEVKHTTDLAYNRMLRVDLEKLGSFSKWTDLGIKDEHLTEDGFISLEIFMEIIWKEIFLRRTSEFGLIAGSWLAGALLRIG